jgi:hypothetical protein
MKRANAQENEPQMTETIHGKICGKTIELNEDLGVAEGQKVEVQMRFVPTTTPLQPPIGAGLVKIEAILGERYNSGRANTADRHNEHQS